MQLKTPHFRCVEWHSRHSGSHMRHDSNDARSSSKNSIVGNPPCQPSPYPSCHSLPLLEVEVVCGVNLIQLKRWNGRRVPFFCRRLSLKSKVTKVCQCLPHHVACVQLLVEKKKLLVWEMVPAQGGWGEGCRAKRKNSFIVFGAFSTSVGTAL